MWHGVDFSRGHFISSGNSSTTSRCMIPVVRTCSPGKELSMRSVRKWVRWSKDFGGSLLPASISEAFRYGSASLDRTWFRKQRLWFAPFGLLDWDFAAWRDLGVLSDD